MMPVLPEYFEHLSTDPLFKPILEGAEPRELKRKPNPAFFLYSSIVMQQLSTQVGKVLLQRFLDIYGGKEPTSAEVAATPLETLRAIGTSNAKASYIKNIALFDLEHGLNIEKFDEMTDDEVISYITSIKGIGKWTAHIFLISALGREDVFPADDLILQKAVAGIYGLDRTNKKEFFSRMQNISQKWSPYRSYASLHLWRWKPEVKVEDAV
jgi:DNA-3-methyladenine glycosylase II